MSYFETARRSMPPGSYPNLPCRRNLNLEDWETELRFLPYYVGLWKDRTANMMRKAAGLPLSSTPRITPPTPPPPGFPSPFSNQPMIRGGGGGRRAKVPTRFLPHRACAPRGPVFACFFRLPPELRIAIYGLLLLSADEAIDVHAVWNAHPRVCLNLRSLLLTSRLVSLEAAHFFYSNNTFSLLEHCDDFNSPGADQLNRSPVLAWFYRIGPVNAASLRHVQLRLRDERPTAYYTGFLSEMTTRAPGIARLALVGERHAMIGPLTANVSGRWEPNQVNALDPTRLAALWTGGVAGRLDHLHTLVLAGRRDGDAAELARVCALVGFGCRVQVVESAVAARDSDECVVLWKQPFCYHGFVTEDGQVFSAGDEEDDDDDDEGNTSEDDDEGNTSEDEAEDEAMVGAGAEEVEEGDSGAVV